MGAEQAQPLEHARQLRTGEQQALGQIRVGTDRPEGQHDHGQGQRQPAAAPHAGGRRQPAVAHRQEDAGGDREQHARAQVVIALEPLAAIGIQGLLEPAALEGLAEQGRALRQDRTQDVHRIVADDRALAAAGALADAVAQHEGGEGHAEQHQACGLGAVHPGSRALLGDLRGHGRGEAEADRRQVIGVYAHGQRRQAREDARATQGQAVTDAVGRGGQGEDHHPVAAQGHVAVAHQEGGREQGQQTAHRQQHDLAHVQGAEQGDHRHRLQGVGNQEEQAQAVQPMPQAGGLQHDRHPGDAVGIDDRQQGRVQQAVGDD